MSFTEQVAEACVSAVAVSVVTEAGVDGAVDELVVLEELHAATVSAATHTKATRILFAWARFGTTAVPNRAHADVGPAGDGAEGCDRKWESSMGVKVSGSISRRIEDLLGLPALVAAHSTGVPSTSDSNRSNSFDKRPLGRDMGPIAVLSYPTDRIRNVVLVGHSGSGKTTLAEALLVKAGAIERGGRVDEGTSVLDNEPEEIRRRLSLTLSMAPFEWQAPDGLTYKINLIDTPGYADFVDEVDAALDEANVDRFGGVLRDFLSSTQFIVVTHSKKTMASATTLYGVTMEESGVSKRVSVRFEQTAAAARPSSRAA